MRIDVETSKIELEEEYGAVLKNVASEAEHAATAVEEYGRAAQRTSQAHNRSYIAPTVPSLSLRRLRQWEKEASIPQPSIIDLIISSDVNTGSGAVSEGLQSAQDPRLRQIGTFGSRLTSGAGLGFTADKYLRGDAQQGLPAFLKYLDVTSDVALSLGSLSTLGGLAPTGTAVSGGAAFLAALPFGPAGIGLAGLALIGKHIHNKEQTRLRASEALAAERYRTKHHYIQAGLDTSALGAERRLDETYDTLRGYDESVRSLTGMNVDDFLEGQATRSHTGIFKSFRKGKGPAGVLSDAQMQTLDTIEQLVVTYRKLADEAEQTEKAAAEYAEGHALEYLMGITNGDDGVLELLDRLENSPTYNQTNTIYQEIRERYGKDAKEVEEAFRVVDLARQRLQAASEAGREISNAYTEAATARAELTQEERQGVQVKAEAVQVSNKQAAAERALAGAQTAQGQATKANAQAEAEQRAGRQDLAAQSRNLEKQTRQQTTATDAQVRTTESLTKETLAAGKQMAATTRRVEDGAAAHSGLTQALRVHQERVTPLTEAYRALSAQIGATVGDVLSGEVSLKDVWESLGRGALETVRKLGRQVVDSLLGDVRDLGRGLPDVIFGPFGGARGSIGFGGSLGFLPSFLAGGSPGGLPAGFPTFPTFPPGGGFPFGGFPVGGGSQLWNAGAATVARYLPFTAPTLASYGFAVSPIGLGIGSGGVAPGLNAGALGVTPRYAAPVPGVNAPPAAGFGPFSPAALGALGGLGGGYGGTALLGALGYQPGLASTIGGFAGGIAGSLATPALTALLAPALGPLAPVLGPLFGTFFGTTLGGLFGFQPTRIDSEKRGIRAFFREEVPGYDYQRKESRNVTGLNLARAAGLDVGPAYLAASLPYVLAADNGGVGTVQRFHNIGVSGLGRSGASLQQARAAALRAAQRTGTHTTAGAIEALNRSLAGGFDRRRDRFTIDKILRDVRGNGGDPRPTRDPVRLRNVVAGIIDIQTEFASFVDSSRLAADILADETEQALTAAGRDAGQYADVLDRIRDGSTHAAEALREIGGIDFKDLTFTAALVAIGWGVRERVGNVGRGLLDSLLIFARELRHRLSEVIFGQPRGAVGSFRHSIGDSFLTFFSPMVPTIPSSGTSSRI